MSKPIKHTEAIWRVWPLAVEVTRGVTLDDTLSEVTDRRLIDVAIRRGEEVVIRTGWHEARRLRDALTDALNATADLVEEQPLAEWEIELLEAHGRRADGA